MAATNFTPIILYHTTTASAAPTAGNLNNGELAINITDGKLFYKDNGGTVQVIATKGTGTIGGSNTQVQYNSSGALAGSANFTFNGTTATINTLNLTNALGTTHGGTGLNAYTTGDLVYASGTNTLAKLGIGLNTYILTSTGSVPQWSAPSAVTVATANNLAGGAAGSVPYQSGASTTTFLSIGSAGQVLTSSGTAPQWSNLSSLGVTSLSFGTTGLTPSTATQGAITVAGTLVTTNGGTGLTSFTANGVVYASSASALATGSALTFDGSTVGVFGGTTVGYRFNANRGNDDTNQGLRFGFSGIDAYRNNATLSQPITTINFTQTGSNGTRTPYYIDTDGTSIWSPGTGVTPSEGMRLTSTGLGIGTSSPSTKLHVAGSVANGAVTYLNNTDTANGNGLFIRAGGSNAGKYALAVENAAASSLLVLEASGNVGIGTSSPDTKLDIELAAVTPSNTSVHGIVVGPDSGTTSVGQAVGIGFRLRNTAGGGVGGNSLGAAVYGLQADSGTNTGTLAFYTRPDASNFSERARITSGGNFCIGTTSSTYRLGVTTNSGGGIQVVTAGATTGNPSQDWYDSTNLTEATLTTGNSLISFGSYSNTPLALITNNTEKARISSDGTFRVKGAGTAGSTDAVQFAGSAPASSLILDSDGDLGVGVSSPTFRLSVKSSANIIAAFESQASSYPTGQNYNVIIGRGKNSIPHSTTTTIASGYGGGIAMITMRQTTGNDTQYTYLVTWGWNSATVLFSNSYGVTTTTSTFTASSGDLQVNHDHTTGNCDYIVGAVINGAI